MARTVIGGLVAALLFSVGGFFAVRATASSVDRFTRGGATTGFRPPRGGGPPSFGLAP